MWFTWESGKKNLSFFSMYLYVLSKEILKSWLFLHEHTEWCRILYYYFDLIIRLMRKGFLKVSTKPPSVQDTLMFHRSLLVHKKSVWYKILTRWASEVSIANGSCQTMTLCFMVIWVTNGIFSTWFYGARIYTNSIQSIT